MQSEEFVLVYENVSPLITLFPPKPRSAPLSTVSLGDRIVILKQHKPRCTDFCIIPTLQKKKEEKKRIKM